MQHAKHGRKTLPISRYMAVIDRIQEELQVQGKSLGVVYLCSHIPSMSYISIEHMTATYPRPFRYSILPRIDTGFIYESILVFYQLIMLVIGIGSEETEIKIFREISKGNRTAIPPLREIYIEYLTDLYVAMEADIYIGAYSNVYALSGSMVNFALNTTLFLKGFHLYIHFKANGQISNEAIEPHLLPRHSLRPSSTEMVLSLF